MKIQFDPKQQYQLDAVSSIVDAFDGQPQEQPEFSVIQGAEFGPLLTGQFQAELGVGNKADAFRRPTPAKTPGRFKSGSTSISPARATKLESWPILGPNGEFIRHCYHYSWRWRPERAKLCLPAHGLRACPEVRLSRSSSSSYPALPIREGVLKNIDITRDHFRAIYNNIEFESLFTTRRR